MALIRSLYLGKDLERTWKGGGMEFHSRLLEGVELGTKGKKECPPWR